MTPTSQKLWSSQYLRGFTVALGIHLVFVILMTYMAIYAAQRFQVGATAAGFAASSFVLGASIARLLVSKYIDFIGRRKTLLVSLTIFILCLVIYSFVEWFGLLLILRMLHGAAFGVATTALTTGVIEMIPLGRLSEGLGYFSLSGTIAHTIGPLVAIQLSVRATSIWIFSVTAICALIALLVSVKLPLAERPVSRDERRRWKTLTFDEMLDRKVLPVVLVVLISSLSYSVIITYLPIYLVGLHLADVASLFFSVWALSTLIVRVIAGRLQDRYGENAVVPVALCLMATGVGVLAVGESFWSFMLAAVVGGIGHGAVAPSLQAVGIKRTTADRLPTATSTHYLGLDAGLALGPLLLGFVIGITGYTGLYLVASAILVLNVILYWLVHGRGAHRMSTSS